MCVVTCRRAGVGVRGAGLGQIGKPWTIFLFILTHSLALFFFGGGNIILKLKCHIWPLLKEIIWDFEAKYFEIYLSFCFPLIRQIIESWLYLECSSGITYSTHWIYSHFFVLYSAHWRNYLAKLFSR